MKHLLSYSIIAAVALLSLSSCEHDEPGDSIKPVNERTVLVLNDNGEIYNLDGELVKTLPNCAGVTQIIVDGDDYFVSGVSDKDRVGYWKNGKWCTLHVDFIDDVDHWAFGIGKWDYYIFLLDYPYVLKNSGLFRLKDSEYFYPAHHGISVSEGECYVVGSELADPLNGGFDMLPILYTEHKGVYEKEELPMLDGTTNSECSAIFAYDRKHFLAGGYSGREPVIWHDRQIQALQRKYECDDDGQTFPLGIVEAIALCDGHIYAGGFEYYDREAEKQIATLWCDGVPQSLAIGPDKEDYFSSKVNEIEVYGNDVYVLTSEMYNGPDDSLISYSIVWLNGQMLKVFEGIRALSIAVL